jgi:N-acetylmuramoyl-L-alanine amidase
MVDFNLQPQAKKSQFLKNNQIKSMDKKRNVRNMMSVRIISMVFLFGMLIGSFQHTQAQKKYTVVLDAGHGGKDPGKVGYKKIQEKDIVLDLVLKVGNILSKKSNIKVIYTREKDVFIGLSQRGRIANKANADLFVSIHCNAHHTDAEGAETWVLGTHANSKNFEVAKIENSVILLEDNYKVDYKGFDPNSPESLIGLTLMQEEYLDQSIAMASLIQDEFTNELNRVNRGVKQAGFVVLHQTYMPSILIEAGFLPTKKKPVICILKKEDSKFLSQ